MNNSTNRIRYCVALLFCLGLLAPYIIISMYSRPCVDDFSYSASVYHYIQSGNWNIFGVLKKAIENDIFFYNNWQGLYVSAFVLALQPGAFGAQYYCLGCILLLVIIFTCISYVVGNLADWFDIKMPKYLISLACVIYVVNGFPSLVQGMYWFNGAWNYIPFFFINLVNWTIILNYWIKKESKKSVVIAVLISFFVSGGNHITSFLNIMVLLLMVVYGIYRRKKLVCVLASWVSAVVGFAIMFLAPGTSVRQGEKASSPVLMTLIQSLKHCYYIVQLWLDVRAICIMIIAGILAFFIYSNVEKKLELSPLLFWIISVVLICGEICEPYYAIGVFGSGRIENIYWLTFTMLLLIDTCYTVVYVLQRTNTSLTVNNKAYLWVVFGAFVLVATFNYKSNIKSVVVELYNGTASEYAMGFDERVNACDGVQKIVETVPLADSLVLKFDDVTDDIDDWRNQTWKEYYGVDVIAK